MKANKTHISFETAKLLKDCGVKSKSVWVDKFPLFNNKERVVDVLEYEDKLDSSILSKKAKSLISTYPAFTWQEIMWEHPEEFFGEKKIEYKYNIRDWKQGRFIMMRKYRYMPREWIEESERRELNIIRPYGGTNNPICSVHSQEPDGKIVEAIVDAVRTLPATQLEKATLQICKYLQQSKYDEADKYFREHCVLIKG